MSGIRPPDCSKLAKNPKNDNDVTIFRHDVNVKFFWRCFVSLVKFSYWSKFHVNIITGLELWQFFYKGLTRNSEIEIPPSEFCPISADWGKLWIPNLAWMSLIERYWMLQNSRVTAFSVLELLRENQLGGGGNFTPTQIRVNGQNLLSLTNYFLNFSNTYWQNVPAIDSLVFFSEHISGTAILAQASGNTCK